MYCQHIMECQYITQCQYIMQRQYIMQQQHISGIRRRISRRRTGEKAVRQKHRRISRTLCQIDKIRRQITHPADQQRNRRHRQQGRLNPPQPADIKRADGKRMIFDRGIDDTCNQIPRNHEENIDADKPRRHPCPAAMEKQHEQNRDRTQTIDIPPVLHHSPLCIDKRQYSIRQTSLPEICATHSA